MDGRLVREEVVGLVKGGAFIEAFEFTIKGKPEPRHASLVPYSLGLEQRRRRRMEWQALELILSELLQDKALEVDAHVSVAVELDADRTFRLGR